MAALVINQAVTIIFRDKMTGKSFEFYHHTLGIVLLVLIAVHVLSNLNWVKTSYFRKTKKKEES